MSEKTEQQPQTEGVQTGLNFNDFILIHNIIAVAAKRGAFEAKEFTVIGNLIDRIGAFIEANTPEESAKEEKEEDGDNGQLELPFKEYVKA